MLPASLLSEKQWSRLRHSQRGSATLEFITAGLILLLPLVYLILTAATVQAGAFAAEGAARQAARVYVRAASAAEADRDAERAVQFALADYGVERESATVSVSCAPAPTTCLTRRGFVTVEVEVRVPLPLAPAGFGSEGALSVTLRAGATQQVSRFWVAP
jgi:Flp pilus assembly protein TadG